LCLSDQSREAYDGEIKGESLMRISSWRAALAATGLIVICMACGCGPKLYRTYVDEEELEDFQKRDWSEITFYVSSLDSITPYVHVFPTGARAEAPNLDPREFCPPESLAAGYVRTGGRMADVSDLVSLPATPYYAIGEVDAIVVPSSGAGQLLVSEPIEDSSAPNGKPYSWFKKPIDWKSAIDSLRKRAAKLGADAVVEVFCGKGVSSYWYPPTYSSIPVFGPSGQVLGNYSYVAPGGIQTNTWKLMGLAVRWRKPEGGGENDSDAR
jgi:hypothetical protein